MAESGPKEKQPGVMSLLIAALLLGALGAGAGAGFTILTHEPTTPAAEASAASSKDHGEATDGHEAKDKGAVPDAASQLKAELVNMEPVHVNLAGTEKHSLRLDASLIFKAGAEADRALIAMQIGQDFLLYLRGVTLDQVDSAAGLEFVREDLAEIVRLRSNGAATDLLLRTLMVE